MALCGWLLLSTPAASAQSSCSTDACTTAAVCLNGQCVRTPLVCPDDGDPCTVEHCDPNKGCVATPLNCDDGNPCTVDSCTTGVGCAHENVPNDTSCDGSATDCVTETCQNGSCVAANVANDTGCDDQNDCTDEDVCTNGICSGSAVTNGTTCGGASPTDPCRPECMNGTCQTGANNGVTCNDDLACTTNDHCSAGTCTGTSTCPANPCAVTFCSPMGCAAIDKCAASLQGCFATGACNPVTGQCFNTPFNEGGSCDDGNACTTDDHCVAGECRSGEVLGVSAVAPTLAPHWMAALAVALTVFAVRRVRLRGGRS